MTSLFRGAVALHHLGLIMSVDDMRCQGHHDFMRGEGEMALAFINFDIMVLLFIGGRGSASQCQRDRGLQEVAWREKRLTLRTLINSGAVSAMEWILTSAFVKKVSLSYFD